MKCKCCPNSFESTNNRQKYCSFECRKHQQKGKYKLSARKTNIKYKYGLSWDEWMSIYDEQEGKCLICQTFCSPYPEHKSKGLAVDHCHQTNRIRGLLCIPCNAAIGYLRDDPDRCYAAGDYLKRERKR